MIDRDTQKKIATFIPDALAHAINMYNDQKKAIKDIDTKDNKAFESYLARLKGCVGQIEVLSKLAITFIKNNILQDEDATKSIKLLKQRAEINQALQDLPIDMQQHSLDYLSKLDALEDHDEATD